MRRRAAPWSGVVLASAGAVLAAALAAAAPAQGAGHEPVEMEVLGVLPLDADAANLLVLRQKGTTIVVPIFVGRSEAAAIRQRLDRAPPTRPLAADLLQHAIDALGGKVLRVEIDGAHAALFRARVTLQQAQRRIDVEARPSDSVALALAAHAPIFATRDVIAEAGLTHDDLARMRSMPRAGDEETAAPGPVVRF